MKLALVSQPVITYMPNAVRLYYDVQNIGDVRYRGDFYVYLEPDNGYYYARKHVNIRPGRIKKIVIDILVSVDRQAKTFVTKGDANPAQDTEPFFIF